METNGKAARLEDLARRMEGVEVDTREIHGRVTDLRRDFERLVGQLIALKWVIGGGVLWLIVEKILAA